MKKLAAASAAIGGKLQLQEFSADFLNLLKISLFPTRPFTRLIVREK